MSEVIDHHHHHHRDHEDDDNNDNNKKRKVVSDQKSTDGSDIVMTKLSDDMILEILYRLPPASVVRSFLCASRDWFKKLSDISFLEKHQCQLRHHNRFLHQEPVALNILLCPTDSTKHPVYAILLPDQNQEPRSSMDSVLNKSLPMFKQIFPRSTIVDSCNGLLLSYEKAPGGNGEIKVLNPVLSHYNTVPAPIGQFIVQRNPHLLFDPSLSPFYKVVMIVQRPFENHLQMQMYTSETKEWKCIAAEIDLDEEGALYWESVMFRGVWYIVRDDDIICLDSTKKDTVSFIKLPLKPENHDRDVFWFGECGGRLQLVQKYADLSLEWDHWFPFSFNIMEMEMVMEMGQPTTNWVQKFQVNINSGYHHLIHGLNSTGIKVMHLYETKEGHQVVLLNVDGKKRVSFNVTTETFGEILTIPYFEDCDNLEAFPFTPTLFPLVPFKPLKPSPE